MKYSMMRLLYIRIWKKLKISLLNKKIAVEMTAISFGKNGV